MIHVLITDDDPFIRESLKIILEQDPAISVVGTAMNGIEAYQFCQSNQVDVVLMDIRMPLCDGVEGSRRIKAEYPNVAILFLTTFDDDDYIIDALETGMNGYLLKNLPPDQIIEGIKMVTQGHMLVHPDVAKKLPNFLNRKPRHTQDLQSLGVSATEQQIIEKIANGLSNKEIAGELFLSEGTIKNYITQILSKLHLRDRTQIAIFHLKNSASS
jgi:DNA-binding NarL/FixJ family response regulator